MKYYQNHPLLFQQWKYFKRMTISWNPGWKHNPRCHLICITDPQGKWPAKPNRRRGRQTWKSFIEAVQSLQKKKPQSKTIKGHPHLRRSWSFQKESNRYPTSHKSVGNFRFPLCMQIVRLFNGNSSREEKDIH